jgi:hypothetical protein
LVRFGVPMPFEDRAGGHELSNSDVAADEALGRCAPSGPRS